MSRDRQRAEEDWGEDEGADFDEDEYENVGAPLAGSQGRAPRRGRRRRYDDEYDEPRRRRGSWSCLLLGCVGGALLVVLLAIAGAFLVAGNGSLPVSIPVPGGSTGSSSNASLHMQESQQALQLTSIAQMQIQNQVGDITISVDPSVTTPTVTTVKKVQATSNAAAQQEFGRISVQVQADSSTNTLTVSVFLPETSSNILSKNSDAVDVTISLPPGSVANTVPGGGKSRPSTGEGQTSVAQSAAQVISPTVPRREASAWDVRGTSSSVSNAGLAPTRLAPALTLDATTSAGNVLINGLHGILMVKDSFGNVTVHQAMLADGSQLETGTGDVVFDGSLDLTGTANPQPMFKLQAEKGNMEVSLPATTNVILDANVNVGSIKSDFPITVTTSAGSPSYYGPLTRGAAQPTAVLVLDVSSGNIDLHRT